MSLLGTGITFNTTGTGVQSIYGGSSCTNQFPRSTSSAGAWTCGSVTSTDVDGTICTSTGTGCLYNRVQEEGANLTQRPTINFIGSSITCADNAGSTRTDCTVTDANTTAHGLLTGLGNDDHTQYLLLAGRSGGQIAKGGTAAGDDLTLSSTANASKGSIFFGSEGEWTEEIPDPVDGSTSNFGAWTPTMSVTGTAGTASTVRGLYLNPTLNYDDAAGVVINSYKAIEGGGTFTVSGAATQASSWTLFDATALLDASVAAKVPPTPNVFRSAITVRYSATSGTGSMGAAGVNVFQDSTIYRNVDAGGTFTVPQANSFSSGMTFTETAGALNITTGRGFYFANPSIGGTPQVTTLVGVDIDKPTRAGTGPGNIGLRNTGTTVYPNTTQAIAAATDTITCSASLMTLTTATGTTILTSNPSIADGATGQVCILLNTDSVATDCITFTDSTLGLQLAGNFTMCQNDSLTVVYNGTDWIELDRSDN
jgi:hypothetical protein